MIRKITEEDIRMGEELEKWQVFVDGEFVFRDGTPEEVIKYVERVKKNMKHGTSKTTNEN